MVTPSRMLGTERDHIATTPGVMPGTVLTFEKKIGPCIWHEIIGKCRRQASGKPRDVTQDCAHCATMRALQLAGARETAALALWPVVD